MWLLAFFPNFLPHAILLLGLLLFIATYFMGLIPGIMQYKGAAKVVAGILIVLGIYLEGGLAYKKKIDVEVAELRVELAQAELKAGRKNVEIVNNYLTTTKVIRAKGSTIVRYIEDNKDRINDACIIPDDVIDAHNSAATLDITNKEETAKPIPLLPPRTHND